MTSINIPRDDAATLVKSTATEREIQPASPYPKVQPVTAEEEASQAPPRQARRQIERRRRNRRQQESSVPLDTRSGHDRRNAARQDSSDSEDNDDAATGIDIYT
jgi:hypothetical protein